MYRLPLVANVLTIALLNVCNTTSRGDDESPTPLQVEDLYRLESYPTCVVAPNGESIAFVRRWVDPELRIERFSLWKATGPNSDDRMPLESNELDARGPVFSPDGAWIAVRSTRPPPTGWKPTPPVPPESDPATDIWFISSDGQRVLPLAPPDKPWGRVFLDPFYGRVAFSPDGQRLLFVADDGQDPRTPDEIDADVIVVRPDQGEGYTGYRPAQIWIADLDLTRSDYAATRIRRVTDDDVWYGDPQWAPEGRTVICHANKTDDVEAVRYSINKNYDLWQIDVESGEQRQLTTAPGPDVCPRIWPDGGQVVYLHVPRKGPHADIYSLARLTLNELGDDVPHLLHDQQASPGNTAPHPPPAFPLPDDCWDGVEAIVYAAPQGLRTATIRIDLSTGIGIPYEPVPEESAISTLGRRTLTLRRLGPPANPPLDDRHLGEERRFVWTNEGNSLEGSITLPPPQVAQAPYPLVLYPHGGPHSRSTLGFSFTAQFLAAQGYLVFQPNFRGSAGYDRAFLDSNRADLGGGDMRDILAGVDKLTAENLIDPCRQFVYGVSYGGFMTTWLVGHTDQFRAAVAQNAVTHLDVMWGVSDIQSWTEWEFEGPPWKVPDRMQAHSPFTYADQVKTPTLILHSREDRRCPLPMGQMYFQALLECDVPTEMVVYPGEGHFIKQPGHQVDVLRRVAEWFRRHDVSSEGSPAAM